MVGILVFMRVKWQNVLFIIYFVSAYSLYTESLINLIIFLDGSSQFLSKVLSGNQSSGQF